MAFYNLVQRWCNGGSNGCSHLIQPHQFNKDPSIISTVNKNGNPLVRSRLYHPLESVFEALVSINSAVCYCFHDCSTLYLF